MGIRIAVATTDGKVVNQHFGRCSQFTIVEIEQDAYSVLELREAPPPCEGHEHSVDGMMRSVQTLQDCEAVLVSRIGLGARRILEEQGITPFEIGLPVDDALAKLQQYYCRSGILNR